METSVINKMINDIISDKKIEQLQDEVIEQLFNSLIGQEFECTDDVRLAFARVKDYFIAGLSYKATKKFMQVSTSCKK